MTWLIPTTVTAAAFGLWLFGSPQGGHNIGDAIGNGITSAFMLMGAVIASLAAWLLWALL